MADAIEPKPENPEWNEQLPFLRDLAQIVAEEGLSELELESDDWKFTLKTATPSFVDAPATPALSSTTVPAMSVAIPASAPAKKAESLTPLVSPMVGVWFRAPSPADPNFVEVGDRVERGQTIGLVEAMKVFNEITAEASGTVAEIPATNGQLVETGQPLVLLK